jgi:hypothetical protein
MQSIAQEAWRCKYSSKRRQKTLNAMNANNRRHFRLSDQVERAENTKNRFSSLPLTITCIRYGGPGLMR